MIQVAIFCVSDETMLYLDLLAIALTTIFAISWIYYKYLSTWASRITKILSMTASRVITSVAPDFNFKTRKKLIKINKNKNTHRCRKYISAKCKGKTARIRNKSPRHSNLRIYDAYQSTHVCSAISANHGTNFKYDSDSFTIGIDNHASRCMSNDIKHFITPLTPTPSTRLRGAGGNLVVKGEGTVRWKIEDDNGKVHTMLIKNCLYVPDLHICLLSPQHWAQQANDNAPNPRGTWCATYGDVFELEWNQRQYRRSIKFDSNTNTPRFTSASG